MATLEELAKEYRDQADIIHERIAVVRKIVSKCKVGTKRMEQTRRLNTLYEMWREAREIAGTLENYYNKEAKPCPVVISSQP